MNSPSIAVVTPSLNQVDYLRICVGSVVAQGYPAVEQIVVDGGSSDGTADYLRRKPGHVTYWHSRPDRGQSHALNLGFEQVTADWVGWQNADDFYLLGALWRFAQLTEHFPEARVVVGDTLIVDQHGLPLYTVGVAPVPAGQWLEGFWPYNQGVFLRRDLIDEVGLVDESLRLHMDADLFARIARLAPSVAYLDTPLGAFRKHTGAKTMAGELDPDSLAERRVLEQRYGRRLWPRTPWQRARLRVRFHAVRLARFGPGSLALRVLQRVERGSPRWAFAGS